MISDLDVYAKYNANGVTTTFAIAHAITSDNTATPENEVEVYTVDESDPDLPVEELQVHVTDYTIVGANVVFVSAPANGLKVYVGRKIDLTQAVDLDVNSEYPAAATEEGLDRITAMIQLLDRKIQLAVKFRKTFSALVDLTFPEPPSDNGRRTIVWNEDGDGLENGPTADAVEDAESFALLAEEWATKIDGIVDGTDYSSKAWAIGGVGVTDTASRGASKEWAIETSSTVDTSEYSSKEYAVGVQRRGLASGGSSKDWANYTSGTVDDTEYSSKYYAQQAAASAAAAATAVQSLAFRDVVYVDNGDSPVTLTDSENGILYICDTSAGNVVFTLPQISTLTLSAAWTVGIQKGTSDANTVTYNTDAADQLNGGATSGSILSQSETHVLIPDTDNTPDSWSVLRFGPSATDVTATAAFGNDERVLRSDGAGRGAQASVVSLTDAGAMSGLTQLTVDNITLNGNDVTANTGALNLISTLGDVLIQAAAGFISIGGSDFTVDSSTNVDINGKLYLDNLSLDGNTIASENVNGNIEIEPNGTGLVRSTKRVAFSDSLKVGENTVAASNAVLDLVSTTKGFLPPRMTEAQRDLISTPTEGMIVYNTDTDKINVYDGSDWGEVGGGGGGGSALKWYPLAGSAPMNEIENGLSVWKFTSDGAGTEKLQAYLKVPASYQPGNPIKVKVPGYSPSNSNTVLMQITAYLVRKNTDAITSTANAETSTNAALTNNLANEYQEFDCNLTPDADGEINAVAVTAGDIIKCILFRGTCSDTEDIRVLDDGTEVTFT